MEIEKVYLCTSKNSKLNKIYLLQTGDAEKETIFTVFEDNFKSRLNEEKDMNCLQKHSLIEDIPYHIDFSNIKGDSYLFEFKEKIIEFLEEEEEPVFRFKEKLKKGKVINEENENNIEEKEGIKFLIIQTIESIIFLSISNNAVVKNKTFLNISINKESKTVVFPRGIQIPPAVTARLERNTKRLFVYDVNRFEQMLTLNENRKAKSKATIKHFIDGDYTVSKDKYLIKGLDDEKVKQQLLESARSLRRLSKYTDSDDDYGISKVKSAVNKLKTENRVSFDDTNKLILVTPESAKTFVGIIYNSIVERLISGDVEVTI